MDPVLILAILVLALSIAFAARAIPALGWRRGGLLLALRVLAAVLLALMVAGPTVQRPREVKLPTRVAIALDTSRSMSLPDEGPRTRLDVAKAAVAALQKAIRARGDDAEIVTYQFARKAVPLPDLAAAKAAGDSTDLERAVKDLVAEGGFKDLVLVTDGDDTEGVRDEPIIRRARQGSLRVSSICVGKPGTPPDIAVLTLSGPRRVLAGAEFDLRAVLRMPGYVGEQIAADLTCDGARVRTLTLPGRETGRVTRIRLRAGAPGTRRYTLSVPGHPGELTLANNARSALVDVVPDKPEVLLIAGRPSQEYAALRRLLVADPKLRARAYVRKTGPRGYWRDDARPAPADVAALSLGQVTALLLQDVPVASLGGLAGRIPGFVRAGGGLAVLGGQDALTGLSPALAAILPASGAAGLVDELVHPRPGPAADPLSLALREGGIPFADLPSWRGRNLLSALRPGAAAALTADGRPLLAARDEARGRALILATPGTHRWLSDPRAGDRERRAYESFWGILLDWLTEPRDQRRVTAAFDSDQAGLGTPLRLLVQVSGDDFQPLAGATVTAQLRAPGQPPTRLTCTPSESVPGRYEATVSPVAVGALQARVSASHLGKPVGVATADARITESLKEFVGSPYPEMLQALAAGTGGRMVTPDKAADLAPGLQLAPRVISRMTEFSPLRTPWAFLALLTLWSLDWILRRRWLG